MKPKSIVALAMLILLITACGPTGNVVLEENQKIKIGIMTPTTGSLAFMGENIVRSAEVSIKELGLEDKVELIVEDVGRVSGGREVVSAYRNLVDNHNVQIIIGGMASDGTMVVAPFLDKDKVVMITPLTGGENIDNAAEYLFRNGPSDIIAGTKPAKDLVEKFNYKKVVLFTDNAEYTLDISKHFRNKFEGEIVSDQIVTPDKTDYRGELAKINNLEYDAIVINTASGVSAGYIIKQLYEIGNDKPVFANFLAYGENNLKIAGNALEKVYIYDPEFDEASKKTNQLFNKIEESYGAQPAIKFHTTGTYDAIEMLSSAVSEVGYDGEKIHNWLLENVQDWDGLNGEVSFDKKGNVKTGFRLKQIINRKPVFVN